MTDERQSAAKYGVGGVWRSHYKYPSSSRKAEFDGEHLVRIYQTGRYLIVESIPGVNHSYVIIRMTLEDGIATGSWHEETDPDGYYKGATYYGAIQFLIAKDNRSMTGKWVGFGKSGEVNTGPWELTYVGEELPDTSTRL